MSNEKANLNINVKNGGSKVGSFVTGGVMGAAVAGGAAYAATGELDGVISEIQDRFNGTDETPEPKPVAEDNAVVTEDTGSDEVVTPLTEDVEVAPANDATVQEEVQPLIEESNIEAADENTDNLQKLENFINDHNNERLQEIQELEEREALKEEIKEELREEIKEELIEEYGLEEVQVDDITGNDNIQVETATGVNDDMSFGEAFAAARAEVGSGGVFEWNGKLYNTFTAEEWEAMSSDERSDFQDRVYNNDNDVAEVTSEPEIEIPTEDYVAEEVIEPEVDDGIEIEVLGMEHNDTYDIDLGGIMIGDQEVVLVDLDSDGGDFDYAIADTDNDGFISQDEIFDLSDDSLGDMDLYASDDTLDDIDTMDDVDMDFNA